MRKVFFIMFGLLCLWQKTFAQKELDTSFNYTNIGVANVVIREGTKIKDNPSNNDSARTIPVLKYIITSKKANTFYTPQPINPPHMVGEPLKRLYKLYAKAGFGNYLTPYGELFFNNLRSKETSYGVHLKHQSSTATLQDKGFSGYSDNEINLYGKKFIRKHTLSGELNYNRNVVHCYGYDINANSVSGDFTKNLFQNISLGVGLQSHLKDSSSLNHSISTRYYNLSDNHNSSENNVFIGADLYTHYMGLRLNLETGIDYYNNRRRSDTLNNTIVYLIPSLQWSGHKITVLAGANFTVDAAKASTFHLYPKIELNYDIIDHIIIPYAGVRGVLKHNGYRSLSMENPFLRPEIDFRNTDKPVELYAGIRGSLSSSINYNIYTSYGKINNMYFFVNDFSEVLQNRFRVVYDSVKTLNFHAELGYYKKEKIGFVFKGDYFHYDMKNEARPWHRPEMQLTFSLNYNLKNKILAHADVFVLGKQMAPKPPQSSSSLNFVELAGVADMNLGLEYRYNKKLSAFANFSNLGAFRYERWQNYPTQRFHFLLGLAYSL